MTLTFINVDEITWRFEQTFIIQAQLVNNGTLYMDKYYLSAIDFNIISLKGTHFYFVS